MVNPLPNELLAAVFENLRSDALLQVVCVSRRFHAVGERTLYANVAIAEAVPRSAPVPRKTVTFCTTLLAHPHLAEGTRKLAVRWHTDAGPREPYLAPLEPVLALLNRALRLLRALDALELALGLSGGPLTSRGILAGCAFPALRTFALSGVGRGAPPHKTHAAPSPPVEWFLAAVPTLTHLRLGDCHEGLALPPGALPALRAFRGSAPTAASVLPGRPVAVLALVGHEFVTERDLAALARSSVRVRVLDLSAMSVTPLLLRDISRHLSGVAHLKVRLALRHTLHHALSGISLLVGLTSVLGAFPELSQLDLSPTALDGVGTSNAADEATLCASWGGGCASLRHIVFPSGTEWARRADARWAPVPRT
ncbi:F-box protein [Phanerochaete sordida]|uniref:F-box protein n=1 Tax=Phanerochaete sordida TaxID=48140 RepID=A0A9P3LFH7_9APHY|nr:F-box protein [Phanerochaete sordida]